MELVVGASEATLNSLISKLGGLLAQEYSLIRGVRGDVQYINDELASMQAFLGDLGSARDAHDRRLKDWMKQVRDMAYDMEDCIDDFTHRLPHDSLSDVRYCSCVVTTIHELWTWWPRREIASRIAELKVRAQHIAERRTRYGVNNPEPKQGNGSPAPDDAWYAAEHLEASRQLIRTENPVGMKEDMEKLQLRLTTNDRRSRRGAVLSLVGFGGVGKTTIATALYRDLGNQFDCRASVTVSQSFDQDEVLRDILRQIKPQESAHEQQDSSSTQKSAAEKKNLAAQIKKSVVKRVVLLLRLCGHRKQGKDSTQQTENKIETMSRDLLVKELKTRLKGKRYLLLIDDIWSAETWADIRSWLPYDNTNNSRVIVTTRFQAVGAACSHAGTDYLHSVSFLSDEESKNLFNHNVSQSPIDVSDEKEPHGEIWKFCGGLPLAIVAMAGLAACNPTKKNDDDHWSRVHKSLFQGKVAPLTLDGVTRILEYCYNDLPADLKTCSLYLSIFPKGLKISTKRLTRRWISESFVTEKQGLSAEEVAETYFNQLIIRKIIRPIDHNSNGKVKSFKVHDMILEYIVSKACQENFITVVGGHWLMPTPSNKVRRLSMQSSGSKQGNPTKGMDLSQVRSLTVFGKQDRPLPFHSFNNGIIQVLDLEGWKGLTDKHLNDICKMLVLKYLSLRRTEVSKIPSEIQKLQHLETLDVRETNIGELPKAFGHLKRLRNMLGGSKNSHKALKMPQEKNKLPMKALRVLSGIEITEDWAKEACLNQLTGLRKLAIYKLNIQEGDQTFIDLSSSIEYLCSCGLQTLAINDDNSNFINSLDSMPAPPRYLIGLELSGKLKRPPEWIKDLNNLYKLILSVTVLRTDTFKLIKDLPELFSLTFTLTADKDDRDIVDILEENKQHTNREIVVPPGGFKSLKLLRFFATLVPRLSFATVVPRSSFMVAENAVMPALERIDMRFEAFEGIYGIETLNSLQEVRLRVTNQADEITKLLVEDLKDTPKYSDEKYIRRWPKIITE